MAESLKRIEVRASHDDAMEVIWGYRHGNAYIGWGKAEGERYYPHTDILIDKEQAARLAQALMDFAHGR